LLHQTNSVRQETSDEDKVTGTVVVLTFFLHSSIQTSPKATMLTVVTCHSVNITDTIFLARVHHISLYCPLEETLSHRKQQNTFRHCTSTGPKRAQRKKIQSRFMDTWKISNKCGKFLTTRVERWLGSHGK